MPNPTTLEEFEDIISSLKQIRYVCIHRRRTTSESVDETFICPNPPKTYDIRVRYKEDFYKYWRDLGVVSPFPLSVEYIVDKFGLYLDPRSFSYVHRAFPHLISSELVEQRNQLMKQREDERKFEFARKMEEKLPKHRVRKVELNFVHQQSGLCDHSVRFYVHGQEEAVRIENLFSIYDIYEIYSLKNIAEHYAELLESPYDFMYVRPYMDKSTQELHTASKLAPLLTDKNLKHIHINRSTSSFGTPCTDLSIHFKDGTSKNMACRDPEVIARYFAPYLDDKSFNAPEIQPFLADEIRVLRASTVGKEISTAQEKFTTSMMPFFAMEQKERELIIGQEELFRATLG